MVSFPVAGRRINCNAEVDFEEMLRFYAKGSLLLFQKGTLPCSILSHFEHLVGRPWVC